LTSDLRVRKRGSTEVVDRRSRREARPSAETGAPELLIEVEPHNCFACGALNEGGLQLDLHVDGDRCWTSIALEDRFQGWDGIAHGGIVCTILDEVMAWSLAASDNWGLTARLNVAFRRPLPLGRPVRAEGWITKGGRRMIATAGRIVDPSTSEVLATAEATYVAADAERKRQLQARYRFRLVPDAADRGAR
jgi:acyl-coenzyme A thioesterase PaaI-like protein